jgi:hypothetical protein
MNQAYPYPDSYNYAKTHALLNREWFGDRDEIREVLDRADQDAWEKVASNRNGYPTDVREAILTYIVKPYNIRDISDKELALINEKKKERIATRFAEAWQAKLKTLPPRPLNDADTANDDAWSSLQAAKVGMDRYLANRKYRAVGATDALLKVHEEKIKAAENEYSRTSKEVVLQDDTFRDSQKHDFYTNWVCEL